MKRSSAVLALLVLALMAWATPARAQMSCTTAATVQGLLTPGAFLYITSKQHTTEVSGAPIIARYEWKVYDKNTGNPDTGPFIINVPLSRAVFLPVEGVPDCYRTTPSPSGLPTNTDLKSIVIAVGREGWGVAPRSAPSNDFLQPLLQAVGAVRVG